MAVFFPGVREFKFLITHIGTWAQLVGLPSPVVSRVQGLTLRTTQDRTLTKDINIETPDPYIPWKNSPPEKNLTASLGIESGTS